MDNIHGRGTNHYDVRISVRLLNTSNCASKKRESFRGVLQGGWPMAFSVPDHGYGPAHGPKVSTSEIRIMGHALLKARSPDQEHGPSYINLPRSRSWPMGRPISKMSKKIKLKSLN